MARVRAAAIATAVASAAMAGDYAYADSPFRFPPFSSSSSPSPAAVPPPSQAPQAPPAGSKPSPPAEEETRVRNDNPRTTAAGFDPEPLIKGAEALREINSSSPQPKKVRFG